MKRRYYYNDGHVVMRASLLSDSYWDYEIQVYIDDKNELRAILDIPTMAGAGHYYADLPIDLGASKGKNLTVTKSFITAKLRNGKLSLTFSAKRRCRACIRHDEKTAEIRKGLSGRGHLR